MNWNSFASRIITLIGLNTTEKGKTWEEHDSEVVGWDTKIELSVKKREREREREREEETFHSTPPEQSKVH
jgi:hypothetical protein